MFCDAGIRLRPARLSCPGAVHRRSRSLGVSKPVNLTITLFRCIVNPLNKRQVCGADGTARIKRSDIGMSGMTTSAADDVRILFAIEAYKD
jgi:polyisoprenoid-binding protein YceI